MPFKRNCDDWLNWDNLRDAVAGTYLNAATITYTLTHPNGTVLASGNLALKSGSTTGEYRVEIDAAVTALMTADKVRVQMVATSAGYKDTRDYWENVETRGRT